MAERNEKLFHEFPEVSTSQWEEQILKDLKGKDYNKALIWQTRDGFPVKPYYRSENLTDKTFLEPAPGEFPYVRGTQAGNDWLIRQDIQVSDFAEANREALEILGKGVNSLGFIMESCTNITAGDLKILLKDISLEAAEINFICPCESSDLTKAFTSMVSEGTWNMQKVKGSMANDPLSDLLLTGKSNACCDNKLFFRLKDETDMAAGLPKFRTIAVNGSNFGNCGSSVVQELAFSLSMGAEYLNRLTDLGMKAGDVAKRIKFNLSIGNNYFFEIAKLRAGRLLWSHIVKAFGTESECSAKMVVHAETGSFNKTIYDPHVNLLRTQTEAMSAALGGAHSVTVMPFDATFRQPGEISERIARNQQILLKEESYLDKITDAAGGSYYIENLTAFIAEQTWELFLETEEKGGFLAALKEGFIQKQVKETSSKRIQNINLRRENLLGVNQFANFSEMITEDPGDAVFQPHDLKVEGADWDTLNPFRVGQALEALRYRSDVYSRDHKRPLAFMLTIGDPAMRKARAMFSCNFFAVGGFEVIDNNGFETIDEGLSSARAADAGIVVICSSDEEYAVLVPEIAGKMGKEILVVAGNPVCRPDLEILGVKNFIHVRSNLYEELLKFQNEVLND
jgi:methylmalonyl-CoA mutase